MFYRFIDLSQDYETKSITTKNKDNNIKHLWK